MPVDSQLDAGELLELVKGSYDAWRAQFSRLRPILSILGGWRPIFVHNFVVLNRVTSGACSGFLRPHLGAIAASRRGKGGGNDESEDSRSGHSGLAHGRLPDRRDRCGGRGGSRRRRTRLTADHRLRRAASLTCRRGLVARRIWAKRSGTRFWAVSLSTIIESVLILASIVVIKHGSSPLAAALSRRSELATGSTASTTTHSPSTAGPRKT
jgi:hypothetical protein